MKFLDEHGLQTLWDRISALFARKTDVQTIGTKVDSISSSTAAAKFTISHSGTWASATVNGSTLYKYTVSVSKVSSDCPDIFLAAASGAIPTSEEITAYGLLDYATVDDTVPCLYLYAAAVPTSDFVILVKGVS